MRKKLGMDETKPDRFDKFAGLVRDYWVHGVGTAGLIVLTYAAKPAFALWAGIGIGFQSLFTVLHDRRSGSNTALRRENARLKRELDDAQAALATAPEMVRDFVKGFLVNLGDERLGFENDHPPARRLTLYSRTSDGRLAQVARYCRNPKWEQGRKFISADAGIAAEAWQNEIAFRTDLPDPDSDHGAYTTAQEELGLGKREAQNLSMKSRLYFAVRVQRKLDSDPLAVLIFESTDPNCFTEEQLQEVLNSETARRYRTEFVELVHRHFPDPGLAEGMNF